RSGDEVIVSALAVAFAGCLMPDRAELAAAADVGQDVGDPAFQQSRADAGIIVRQHRDFETAVGVKQGGIISIILEALAADLEIRDFGPIFGSGFVLANFE